MNCLSTITVQGRIGMEWGDLILRFIRAAGGAAAGIAALLTEGAFEKRQKPLRGLLKDTPLEADRSAAGCAGSLAYCDELALDRPSAPAPRLARWASAGAASGDNLTHGTLCQGPFWVMGLPTILASKKSSGR